MTAVTANGTLEFGINQSKPDANDGRIGYKAFSSYFDIIGAYGNHPRRRRRCGRSRFGTRWWWTGSWGTGDFVFNRPTAANGIYFGEDADTGGVFFRGTGAATFGGALKPPTLTDAAAPAGSVYYSSTAGSWSTGRRRHRQPPLLRPMLKVTAPVDHPHGLSVPSTVWRWMGLSIDPTRGRGRGGALRVPNCCDRQRRPARRRAKPALDEERYAHRRGRLRGDRDATGAPERGGQAAVAGGVRPLPRDRAAVRGGYRRGPALTPRPNR
jgi:hypothetical protein